MGDEFVLTRIEPDVSSKPVVAGQSEDAGKGCVLPNRDPRIGLFSASCETEGRVPGSHLAQAAGTGP